jgi:single-stranded-DNA-specific exonuclease
VKQIKQRAVDSAAVANLQDIHPVLARVYVARGIRQTDDLDRSLQALLPYHDLKDIDKAVAILKQGLESQKRFLIVGDFDADGATATTLCKRALHAMGAKHVDYIVPNRFEYGYGLTPQIVQEALKFRPDILITVDNGISSVAGVEFAKQQGLQVIITDHHLAPATLPNADAIVNPNQKGCAFASKNLAGVGVIFYVMLALRAAIGSKSNMAQWLDLVALGTIADVVPLDKNNRILVHQGLQRIRAGLGCEGIKALLHVSNRNPKKIQASDLGFALGPRLNAAGRLQDMAVGIAGLLSDDASFAQHCAQQLDNLNAERKTIEGEMQASAIDLLNDLQLELERLPLGLSLFREEWHQGVVGILASRIKEKYHRPVVCFSPASEGSEELKGSARSVSNVHIRDVLEVVANENPGLIEKFGGHAMAAGLSIQKHNVASFQKAFDQAISDRIQEADCVSECLTDGELGTNDFNLNFARELQQAGPWGQQFPEPLFCNNFIVKAARPIGEKHMRYQLQQVGTGNSVEAVHFNVDAQVAPDLQSKVDVVYQLDINEYQGVEKLQLIIREIV